MINFNIGTEKLNKFLGSESKITVIYDGEIYMLKFPDPIVNRKSKDVLRYKYNQYSEHIGSSIFKSCGFFTQETALGYFNDILGKDNVVVACKDFTQNGDTLYEFAKIANSITSSYDKLASTIENVYHIINNSVMLKDKENILNGFWDMFVIDALIGNDDRHFNNWGVLERKDGDVVFAPIYDCGSSLSAMLDDDRMEILLSDPDALKNEEFYLRSSYSINGKRAYYPDIFKNPPDDLSMAIKRTVPKVSIDKILDIVDSVPISAIRKEYLKRALTLRYEQILLPAFCDSKIRLDIS